MRGTSGGGAAKSTATGLESRHRRGGGLPAWQLRAGERATAKSAAGVTAIILFVFVWVLADDRAVLTFATGGRGALPLLTFVAPAAAVYAIARHGTAQTLSFVRSPVFLIGVLPYLAFTFILPFLGVMFTRYSERTLVSVAGATTAFSFMVLGAATSTAPLRQWRPWIAGALLLQLAYAAGQASYLNRWPGWELFSPFHSWDLSLEGVYGTLVQARSSGLFFNPNELGLWAGAAAILAWTILTPRWRLAGVALAIATLVLSQSRGATVALVAACCVGIAMAFVRGRVHAPAAARTVIFVGLATALAIIVVLLVEPSDGLVDRFSALAAVVAQGPRADANLAGRLDYWASVVDLNAVYPLGTLGPPEALLGTAVDSTWFRVLAQGSVPYLGALILLLAAPFALHEPKFGDTLIMITVLFAVAGLTQTPFNYPVALLFWALLGAALQMSVTERAALPAGGEPTDSKRDPGLAGSPRPGSRRARSTAARARAKEGSSFD